MGKNGELPSRQKRMITALLTSRNIGEACELAGVGRTTLTRWMGDNKFTAALCHAETCAIQEAARHLIAGQDEALASLRDLMTNGLSENVRRQAANDWLNNLFRYRELASLEARVTALEEGRDAKKY